LAAVVSIEFILVIGAALRRGFAIISNFPDFIRKV
jgi:hypothetical protein